MRTKRIIEAENLNLAKENSARYLSESGFSAYPSDFDNCVNTHGYYERYNNPCGEALIGYIGKNKFEIIIETFKRFK